MNTRMMIRLLWCTLQIPILALVDADPHGEFIVQAGLEKKLEFKLILWASSSLVFLAQGHFLPFLVNDNVRE